MQSFNDKTFILIVIAAFFSAVQLFYYLFFYARLWFNRKQKQALNTVELPPVSVVICAKNEYENLKNFLPKILKQDYPKFEVIVVNDASTDDTEFILKYLEKQYPNLRHTNIPISKFEHGKKLALTIGIKSAKHEHLLLTDADVYPISDKWIKNMISRFDKKTQIVLSYGAFEKSKTFLNKLIRYDNFFNSLQFLSFAKAGIPYMGTGRNLAYKKSLFVENKGFASHYSIPSGDDDLFVNENADKNNTQICINPEAFTYSPAKTYFKNWIFQKSRHLTTGVKYKLLHKFLLTIEPLSRIFFYTTLLLSIVYINLTAMYITLFTLFVKIFILKLSQQILKEKDLFIYSLLFDITLPLLYVYIHLNKLIIKTRWK